MSYNNFEYLPEIIPLYQLVPTNNETNPDQHVHVDRVNYKKRPKCSSLRHNAVERQRRSRIKQCCDILRSLVPGLSDKADKATVLEWAVHYVNHLTDYHGFKCDCIWSTEVIDTSSNNRTTDNTSQHQGENQANNIKDEAHHYQHYDHNECHMDADQVVSYLPDIRSMTDNNLENTISTISDKYNDKTIGNEHD